MKYYCFDTCALLDLTFESILNDVNVIGLISDITLKELENIKTSQNKDNVIKYNARKVIDYINNSEKIIIVNYNLSYGFKLFLKNLPKNNDNKIIISFYQYLKKNKINNYVFYTKDKSCKLIAENFFKLKSTLSIGDTREEYSGFVELCLDNTQMAKFYENILPQSINYYDLIDNQYLIIRNISNEVVDKYKWHDNKYIKIQFQKAESKMFGKIVPIDNDIYQQLALDSLSSNQMTVLGGPAGSGKSYLAFGYMFSLLEKGKIDRIIIFCNTVATKGSAKLGFYPGSKDEKLLDSQIGNFLCSKLGDKIMVEKLIADGTIVLLPMSDIRGYDTNNMNAAIYITEAQNLDIELMRLALQRIGEDDICILDGDSNAQVDLDMYAGSNNGMKRVSEIFRGNDFYGEITLQNIHRSKIARLAQRL